MLRGILVWAALCLCLAVVWQLADAAAARAELFHESYATEALLPAPAPSSDWHDSDHGRYAPYGEARAPEDRCRLGTNGHVPHSPVAAHERRLAIHRLQ